MVVVYCILVFKSPQSGSARRQAVSFARPGTSLRPGLPVTPNRTLTVMVPDPELGRVPRGQRRQTLPRRLRLTRAPATVTGNVTPPDPASARRCSGVASAPSHASWVQGASLKKG